jgi:hypothetical protein
MVSDPEVVELAKLPQLTTSRKRWTNACPPTFRARHGTANSHAASLEFVRRFFELTPHWYDHLDAERDLSAFR